MKENNWRYSELRLKFADFNKDFNPEKVVTNAKDYENKKFTEDGIYSESIFGSYQDNEYIRGWIDFGDYYIINPLMFSFLKKVIPKLPRMIKKELNVDMEGNTIENENEIDNIGLLKFKENFFDYVELYGDTSLPEWTLISENIDLLFINKFPILPSKLRPGILVKNVITSSKVNKLYNFAIQYSNELKASDIEIEGELNINNLIYNLQIYVNTIVKTIIDISIKKKKGWLRSHLMGSRINNSARNVLGPLVLEDGLLIEDIAMPYKTYLELYKKQLINLIVKTKGINYVKANYIWRKSTLKFNPEMYKYMLELNRKSKYGQYILLNRNPTINIGSILRLKVKIIKDDYDDNTLQISNNILTSCNADYDGDVLNIIPLFNKHLIEAFECFAPYKLMINANDGRFNSDFSLEKEQKIGIFVMTNANV